MALNSKLSRLEEVKRRAVMRTQRRIQANVEKMAEDNPTVADDFALMKEQREAKEARRAEAREAVEAAEAKPARRGRQAAEAKSDEEAK